METFVWLNLHFDFNSFNCGISALNLTCGISAPDFTWGKSPPDKWHSLRGDIAKQGVEHIPYPDMIKDFM